MIYADLPAGATVFLDASVFIHHFEPNALYGPAATEFLERVEKPRNRRRHDHARPSEVAHRLMTTEAMQAFGGPCAGIAVRLRNHPAQVQTVTRFRQAIQQIPLFAVRILSIDPSWLDLAAEASQQTGLLHNDALIIAAMRIHGLANLASVDSDFDRVPGITRYGPS